MAGTYESDEYESRVVRPNVRTPKGTIAERIAALESHFQVQSDIIKQQDTDHQLLRTRVERIEHQLEMD